MTGPVGPMTRQQAADLLAVDAAAPAADVQRAFLRAARRVHPDVLPDADESERRDAADAFDRLLRARDVLLAARPQATGAAGAPGPDLPLRHRDAGRGLGGSLVVLALLAFLLVLLVTVEQSFSAGSVDPGAPGPPGSSSAP